MRFVIILFSFSVLMFVVCRGFFVIAFASIFRKTVEMSGITESKGVTGQANVRDGGYIVQ